MLITKFFDNGKIIVLDNVFSEEECNNLINLIEMTKTEIKSGGRLVAIESLYDLSRYLEVKCNNFIPPYVYRHTNVIKYDPHSTDYNYWLQPHINDLWSLVKSPPNSYLSLHLDRRTIYSIDNCSFYTIMCYLNDSDGSTLFKDDQISIDAKMGRIVIFDQKIVHEALVNSNTKYIIKSEIMYIRSKSLETDLDNSAVILYNKAKNAPNKEAQLLEEEAFKLSPLLEEIVLLF